MIVVAGPGGATTPPPLGVMRFGIPLYVDPTVDPATWAQLNADLVADDIVVADPANGPGTEEDPSYTAALGALPCKVYGYVDTNYEARTTGQVQADVDTWLSLYPGLIDGIFFDQCAVDTINVAYLTTISGYAHGLDLEVAFNPGQPDMDAAVPPLAEVICNFEGNLATYLATVFPPLIHDHPGKWWHLVYDYTPGDSGQSLDNMVFAANSLDAKFVFYTDSPLVPMPWDGLGTYWSAEKTAVRAV